MFYLIAALLCLLAAAFVLVPGWFTRTAATRLSHDEAVRSIYKERLDEMANDAATAEAELDETAAP